MRVSKEAAGSQLRWGNTATFSSIGLVVMLLLALLVPTVAVALIVFIVAAVLLGYASFRGILKVPALRLATLKLMLANVNKLDENSDIYRLYLGIIGILGGKKPRLYSLQEALPHLPVPKLEETLKKYLSTVKPLISASEYEATVVAVEEFKNGVGQQLQKKLLERAADPKILNWLEEWWENFIYLQGRKSLMVFSNWYGTDRINVNPEPQLDRATNLISELLVFHRMCENQELEPIRLMGTVPFCMWQYVRIYSTSRNPGKQQDVLVTYPMDAANHIIVIRKGQIWKVDVKSHGKSLSRKGIKQQLVEIMENSNDEAERPIGVFTAQERTVWADIRQQLIDDGNKDALETVDKALFVVALEEVEPQSLEEEGATSWLKNATNRWCDKSFSLVVYANGRIGLNVEHTWADAPVLVHMFDFIFGIEDAVGEEGKITEIQPKPQRITWKVTPKVEESLQVAIATAHVLAEQTVSLKIVFFEPYGKGFIKQVKVSPDGYVQMAIQLAYYSMYEKLVLTYESAHTRQFLHGRTETVRSVSNESLEFVKAMKDRLLPAKEKLQLLRKAIEGHVAYMKMAMAGQAIDRHLLGLYIQSKLLGLPTPSLFADKAWALEFKMATSQTPGVRTTGGGFAPMCFDGYGVSYLVAEDRLTFHITSYKSCPDTSSERFSEALIEALNQMRSISVVTSEMRRSLSQGELPQA